MVGCASSQEQIEEEVVYARLHTSGWKLVPRPPPQKPATLDRAIAYVNRGQYQAAIPTLEKITKDYRGLKWDAIACPALVECYIKLGQPERGIPLCEELLKVNFRTFSSKRFE